MKRLFAIVFWSIQVVGAQELPLRSMQQTTPIDYKYYNLGGDAYCNSGIAFYPNGMVICSGGCEAREHVSYGKWKLVGDSIEILPSQGPSQSLISNVLWSAQDTGDSTTFVVTDVHGRGVERFVFDGICENVKYQHSDFLRDFATLEHRMMHRYMIWDSNYVNIDTKEIDSLVLSKLEIYTKQRYTMSTRNLPDTVYIQLAIGGVPLYYNEIIWDEIEKPFKYKLLFKDVQRKDWDIEIKEVLQEELDQKNEGE